MSASFIHDKDFSRVVYTGEEIKFNEYENCTFNDCDFTLCSFLGIMFTDCTFTHCNFKGARINYVGLQGVYFKECDFTDVNFAMTDQEIHEFHFMDCLLDYSKWYALSLKKISFVNCSLISADFMQADLTEARFDHCNLHRAVFTDANASKADFYSSYNFTIDPEKTKLKNAIFSSEGVKGLLTKYQIIIR